MTTDTEKKFDTFSYKHSKEKWIWYIRHLVITCHRLCSCLKQVLQLGSDTENAQLVMSSNHGLFHEASVSGVSHTLQSCRSLQPTINISGPISLPLPVSIANQTCPHITNCCLCRASVLHSVSSLPQPGSSHHSPNCVPRIYSCSWGCFSVLTGPLALSVNHSDSRHGGNLGTELDPAEQLPLPRYNASSRGQHHFGRCLASEASVLSFGKLEMHDKGGCECGSMTGSKKITEQEPQQKADADQAAMWESIGNVSHFTSGLKPSVLFLLCWLSSPTIQNA